MFEMSAPYPGLQTTSLLPNPQFSDSESLTDTLDVKRGSDGTLYTYKRTKNLRMKLQWTFLVTRNKGLEIRAFITSYSASKIRIVDHNDRIWIGHFINNPAEFTTRDRGAPAISPMPRGETVEVTIEFEGVEA